jgi:serine/threonine-protein kinase
VDAVLQGAFSGSQTRLHVTVELVRTSDDAVLWSATYDGRSNQLIGIQDTITQAITRRLRVAPPAAATVDIASRGSRGTANDTAYDLMLRGRYAFDHADFPASESYLRRALAADPHFARARAYLAVTQAALPLIGIGPLDSLNMEVRRNADEALAVDSTVVEAYIAESNALSNDLRLAEALTPLERGMAIDRNQPNLLLFYAQALAAVGRMPEALAAARQAHERDPLSVSAWAIYGYYLAMSGRVDEGLAQMQGALALDPNQPISQRAVGYWFAFDGHPDSALAHLQRSFALDSSTYGGRSNLVFGYASTGRWADAERERARFARNRRSTSGNYERATVELAFGEYDNAMTSLERSVQAREPLLWIPSLPCDPLFDPLKANPRFDLLMKRLGAKACAPRLQWPIARPPRRQPSSD